MSESLTTVVRTWMRSSVLAVALLACGGPSTTPSLSNSSPSEPVHEDHTPVATDEEQRLRAHVESETAVRELDDARRRIEQLTHQVAIVERKIAEAAEGVVIAQTDAARATAEDQLVFLQREKAELDARITVEIERARDAERRANGTKLPAHCAQTPTAKECI